MRRVRPLSPPAAFSVCRKTVAAFLLTVPTLWAQAAAKPHLPLPPKNAPSKPLNDHDRALQLLDRFTFAARPGDVERLMAMGREKWLDQQLTPDTIPDDASNRRLADYPTLNLTAAQALAVFPDRKTIIDVAEGKAPYPTDPLMAALYQVQVYKYQQEKPAEKPAATPAPIVRIPAPNAAPAAKTGGKPIPVADTAKAPNTMVPEADREAAEKALQKQQDQATATRIAGELFALPKRDRMAALIKLPPPDRSAFATSLANDQKNLLLADFTPKEREIFSGMAAGVNAAGQIGNELAQARMVRDVLTERQLQEVMTDFWFNHFNVFLGKDSDQWYTPGYERDVIRRHALGKFRDLLLATAMSPAMLVYLDNLQSIGPNSVANGGNPANPNAKKGNKGLNENYGRELMELHTVGVNGGYTQADVTALAAILTGWTVDKPGQGGGFQYDPKRHEPGPKQWFGYTIAADGAATRLPNATGNTVVAPGAPDLRTLGWNLNVDPGMRQGLQAISLLAASPQTAHFICWKIAQRFVADAPPPALVDRLAKTYLASDGDIKAILRDLAASPEFNSQRYFRNKVKTPEEFVVSAFRATATDPANPGALVNTLATMGMPLYKALPPTGYYLTADQWMNSTALVDRLNFAYQLTTGKLYNQRFDSARVLALGLMAEPGSNQKGDGESLALRTLEGAMIGVPVSAKTEQLIRDQAAKVNSTASTPNSTQTLDLLTALILGSPDFQLH